MKTKLNHHFFTPSAQLRIAALLGLLVAACSPGASDGGAANGDGDGDVSRGGDGDGDGDGIGDGLCYE